MYMANRILISESDLLSIINKLIMIREDESDDFSSHDTYSELDLHDIFFALFRNWVSKKIGDKSKDLPITYLLKKYGREFFDEIGETEHRSREGFEISRWGLQTLIRNALKRGNLKVPSLRPKVKFTEKFKKAIQYLIGRSELPNYLELRIDETIPYNLEIKTIVDYPQFLKSEQKKSLSSYGDKFVRILKDYIGVEEGEPYLGEIRISRPKTILNNLDSWVKTELKDIKNFIKTIDKGKNVHRIKFEAQDYKGELKLIFKGYASWSTKSEIRDKLKQHLKDSGYKNIQVDI